jgi:hypothetical protein
MSTTYSVTRDQIISSALRKLGVLELGATPDSDTISNSSQVLNLMIKQWMTDGIKLWTVVEYTLPLVASKNSYTIGPSGDLVADKPLRLIQAFLRNIQVSPNVDTPMQIFSKEQYNVLGSKNSTGTPNSVFLDPNTTYSTVYIYLTPDSNTATNYQMHLVVQKPIDDILTSISIPNFPVEWMQALTWGLADQLALEYGLPVNHRQEINLRSEKYKSQLEDWDVEYSSTYFTPDTRMRMSR